MVVATDASFALPTAVTLRSLLTSAGPDGDIEVTVLHDDVPIDLRRRVDASLPPEAPDVRWVAADVSPLGTLPPSHLPRATWFRLLAVEVLPPEIDRFVYLDVDVLVRRSVVPLWSIDLGGSVLGAVRSVNFPSFGTWGAFDHWRRHGIDPRLPFFNSGVLVVDTRAWEQGCTSERILEVLASGDIHGGADQQTLNVVLAGRWAELDPMWNQQTPLLDDRRGGHLLYDDETIERARTDPVIIHYLDRPKPWHVDSAHPEREAWRAAAAETAFAPIRLERTPRLREAQRRMKRAASVVVRGR